MSLVTLEAGTSAVVEFDPAGAADQLSALLYRGQENSRRARALMEVIRPAVRDLPLPAATKAAQAAGLLLLPEQEFCLAVAERYVPEAAGHPPRFARRMAVGLSSLRVRHAGVAGVVGDFAARGRFANADIPLVIEAAATSFDRYEFGELWTACLSWGPRTPSAGLGRALLAAAAARRCPLPAGLAENARAAAGTTRLRRACRGYQDEVAAALDALGVPARRDVLVSGVVVDFLVGRAGRRAALFADVLRRHYVGRSFKGGLCGEDVLANRALHGSGVPFVRVRDIEWRPTPPADRPKLLADCLKQLGV